MSVALDAVMTGGNQGGDTHAVSAGTSMSTTGMTVGGSATLLVVVFGWQGASPPTAITVTWNGVALTQRALASHATGVVISAGVYVLISPASGAQTLAANWTGSSDCYMSAISFTGTDTTTGVVTADTVTDNTDTSSPSSVAVASAASDATVAVQCCNGDEATTTQTKFAGFAGFNPGYAASYAIGGSPTVTHQFTNASGSSFALAGVHVLAGASGPALPVPMMQRPVNTLLRM